MKAKLALMTTALITSLSFSESAFAQAAGGRPANATPPTVEQITARLQARGLSDAQIAERIAAVQAAVAAGQRPQRPAGVGGPPAGQTRPAGGTRPEGAPQRPRRGG